MSYAIIFIFIFVAIAVVVGGIVVSRLLAPHHPGGVKNETFECGEQTIGSAWVQFKVGYYLFALMFLIFDVESVFLFPWAVTLRETGIVGLIEVTLFVFVLVVGLLYAWKKGALEWD